MLKFQSEAGLNIHFKGISELAPPAQQTVLNERTKSVPTPPTPSPLPPAPASISDPTPLTCRHCHLHQ